jgi:hypothetical protein
LVVRKDGFPIVLASSHVNAIVDEVITVDNAAIPDEVPFLLGPVLVVLFLIVANAISEMRTNGQK